MKHFSFRTSWNGRNLYFRDCQPKPSDVPEGCASIFPEAHDSIHILFISKMLDHSILSTSKTHLSISKSRSNKRRLPKPLCRVGFHEVERQIHRHQERPERNGSMNVHVPLFPL